MRTSQQVAAAVALRALGYHVRVQRRGVLVDDVALGAPAAGKLLPTDVIVAVDGHRVQTPADLRRLIGHRRPGDRVRLAVRSGSGLRTVVIRTASDPRDRSRAVIGIYVTQGVDIKLPFPVRFDLGSVGGPSAGLAFALDLVEELGHDIDHGQRVAATGELAVDGSVHRIGGVKQKALGALRSHVDIFLVPAGDNARDARRYARGLRVVPVKTFRQALRALKTLAPSA
jgi:PDZ domain-containing protein